MPISGLRSSGYLYIQILNMLLIQDPPISAYLHARVLDAHLGLEVLRLEVLLQILGRGAIRAGRSLGLWTKPEGLRKMTSGT
jgi:hypothetical protein